jgi:hypothetical protein
LSVLLSKGRMHEAENGERDQKIFH